MSLESNNLYKVRIFYKQGKMALEKLLKSAKKELKKVGRSALPYVLSLGLAATGYGCAGAFPNPQEVREMKPKPTSETVQYKSKFEESVIREMPQGYERDYYAAVWNMFNRWFPEEIKKKALSSIDTLSVVTQKPIVDSLINVYTLPLDEQPDEPGNQFLKKDFPEIINWCNSNFVSHPGALYLSQYFDDVGLLVLGNGVPEKTGNRGEQEKAITTSRIRFEGPPVDTWRITWSDKKGENIFQGDGYGYWKWVSNSNDQARAQNEGDFQKQGKEYQQMMASLPFFQTRKNIEFKEGITVVNRDEKMDPNSIDPYVATTFDPYNLEGQCAVINLGINLENFFDDSLASIRGSYNVSVLGTEEIFEKDSINIKMINRLGEEVNDSISKQVYPLQLITRNFPDGIANKGLTRGLLGLDLENAKGQHYKKTLPFLINKPNSDFNLLYGWFVRGNEYSHPDFIENRPFVSYEVFNPGDSIECLFQIPGMDGSGTAHMRFRFERRAEQKKRVSMGSIEPVPPEWNPNIPEKIPYEIPFEEGTFIANINPSLTTFNIIKVAVPKLREGNYMISADCYMQKEDRMKQTSTILFPDIYISEKKHN